MLRLIEPALRFKAAILAAVPEMNEVGEWNVPPEAFAARFETMLHELAAARDPATAPPGVLPYEDFWLIDGDVWIGLLTLRLQLNEQFLQSGGHIGYVIRPSKRRRGYGTALLRLGLGKARERGLLRVLLTCDETNVASRKVIEASGGQLENAVTVEGQTTKKLRYWITLPPKGPMAGRGDEPTPTEER
jgi:predicted acetyltransferase